jgi:beta-phosphoglucomutase-like phosphatase (HAD superfamily)
MDALIEDASAGVEAARTASMTVRTTHADDELAAAHHRADTPQRRFPLITDWLTYSQRATSRRTGLRLEART